MTLENLLKSIDIKCPRNGVMGLTHCELGGPKRKQMWNIAFQFQIIWQRMEIFSSSWTGHTHEAKNTYWSFKTNSVCIYS